jgi:hypothetical protein
VAQLSTLGKQETTTQGSGMCANSKIQREEIRQPFMQLIRRHCVPLHAVAVDTSHHSEGGLKFTGGSALLWESMEGRFLVTACHVWRELVALAQRSSEKYRILTYDLNGPVLIHLPTLIDESEDLDLAVFTVRGIKDFNPNGKVFLQTPNWPTAPAQSGEIIVGCGYTGDKRIFRNGQWELQILFWAHGRWDVSQTGTRLLLDGQSGKGKASYFTKSKPKGLALPGISGAPLFALRDTLDWVGVVRSGCGEPPNGYSIQATPSSFVGPDGRIRKTQP